MWKLRGPHSLTGEFSISNEKGEVHTDGMTERDGEKIRFMVKAANSHDLLVKALKRAEDALQAHSLGGEEGDALRVVQEALKVA